MKTQNVRVWSKERFTDGKGANGEDERPSGASDTSCSLVQEILRGWGNRYVEMLVGRVLVGGPRNLTVYVTGHQHWIFLNKERLVSERVPVFQFPLCPGLLVQWVVGEARLWF